MRPVGTILTEEERRVQEVLRDLGEVRSDDAFRKNLKQAFVSGTIEEWHRPEPKHHIPWRSVWQVAFASAVVLVALTFIFTLQGPAWKLCSVEGHGSITVNGREVDSRDTSRLAGLIEPGARIQVAGEARLDIMAGDVMFLELDSGTDLTLPNAPRRWFPRPLVSDLYRGEIRLKTGPGFSGRRLTVNTAEGRILVTGTVISVYKGEDFTCVCILEGTASIGKDDAHMEKVGAGLRKVMFSGDRPSEIMDIEPHHKEELLKFLTRSERVFD